MANMPMTFVPSEVDKENENGHICDEMKHLSL